MKAGASEFYQLVGMNYNVTVEKCWFEEKEINCKQILFFHVTDSRLCFTINTAIGPHSTSQSLIHGKYKMFLHVNSTNLEKRIYDLSVWI